MTTIEFPRANAARLLNGLAISHIPCISKNIVIGIYLKCGSAYEVTKNNGCAHILMRMISHNPKITEKLEKLHILMKTSIAQQYVSIRLEGSVEIWREMVSLLAEIVRAPVFSNQQFIKERSASASQALSGISNSASRATSIMYLKLWGMRQLGLPVTGLPKNISELELSDVESFYNTWFSPEISLVIAAGSVPQNDFMQSVSENFKAWAPHAPAIPILNRPVFTGAIMNTIQNASCGDKADLIFAFSTTSTQGREVLALNLLAEYLAADENSILQSSLKSAHIPLHNISAKVFGYSEGSLLLVQIQTNATEIDKTLSTVSKAFTNFITLLSTETGRVGFEDCKRIMKTVIGTAVSTPDEYVNYYAMDRIFMGTSDPLNHLVAGMKELDIDTFRAMCTGFLNSNNLMVLVQSKDCMPISEAALSKVASIGD